MAIASSQVSAGDDILAAHHNDLRDDALITGQYLYNPVKTRYYSLNPSDFVGERETTDYRRTNTEIWCDNAAGAAIIFAGVQLPNGSIITSFKVYWYRDDALASGVIELFRSDFVGNPTAMAQADSDSNAGFHSVEDTTITNATIDNQAYSYCIRAGLTNNNATTDVNLQGVVITYTITEPFP